MASGGLGDFLQVFATIAVLAGLFGRKKNAKKGRAPQRRPPARPVARLQQVQAKRTADPLLVALQRRLEEARVVVAPAPPKRERLEPVSLEGQSLEVIPPEAQALGEADHDAFEKKYVKPLADPVIASTQARRPLGGFPHALIWAEILAPPKALRD